jgi:hypothetical protein
LRTFNRPCVTGRHGHGRDLDRFYIGRSALFAEREGKLFLFGQKKNLSLLEKEFDLDLGPDSPDADRLLMPRFFGKF